MTTRTRSQQKLENADLVEDILARGTEAEASFNKLMRAYTPLTLKIAHKYVAGRDEAMSVLNDTWFYLWQKLAIEKVRPEHLYTYIKKATEWHSLQVLRDRNTKDRKLLTYESEFEEVATDYEGESVGSVYSNWYMIDRGGFGAMDDGHTTGSRMTPIMTRMFDPVSEQLEAEDTIRLLGELINSFPEQRREPLIELFIDGESQKVVAEKYGVSTRTLRTWSTEFSQACSQHPDIGYHEPPPANTQANNQPTNERVATAQEFTACVKRNNLSPLVVGALLPDGTKGSIRDFLDCGISNPYASERSCIGDIETFEDEISFQSFDEILEEEEAGVLTNDY